MAFWACLTVTNKYICSSLVSRQRVAEVNPIRWPERTNILSVVSCRPCIGIRAVAEGACVGYKAGPWRHWFTAADEGCVFKRAMLWIVGSSVVVRKTDQSQTNATERPTRPAGRPCPLRGAQLVADAGWSRRRRSVSVSLGNGGPRPAGTRCATSMGGRQRQTSGPPHPRWRAAGPDL